MNATVAKWAENAARAADSAGAAREGAQKAWHATEEVARSIDRVRELSECLSQHGRPGRTGQGHRAIMSVISDIADQTNLLA
jgi:methyl-accepting chemotaxis protein